MPFSNGASTMDDMTYKEMAPCIIMDQGTETGAANAFLIDINANFIRMRPKYDMDSIPEMNVEKEMNGFHNEAHLARRLPKLERGPTAVKTRKSR